MISNNLKNTDQRLHKIYKEIAKLTKSLEVTQGQLEGEIKNIIENIKHLEISVKGIEESSFASK